MKDPAVADTKDRLLRAGERLFRTQGYAGTGLKELTQAAEAPWGSLYHFFPGGKAQLGAEVMAYAGQLYLAGWRRAFERRGDPGEAVEKVFLAEVGILEASGYADGCPIASVTLDIASTNEALRTACAEVFASWTDAIEQGFRAAGAPREDAAALAGFVLSALEGAIVLSRAARSPAPLLQSARFVSAAIDQQAQTWTRPGASA